MRFKGFFSSEVQEIEIKIKLNFYFRTSLWCLKRFSKYFRTSEIFLYITPLSTNPVYSNNCLKRGLVFKGISYLVYTQHFPKN